VKKLYRKRVKNHRTEATSGNRNKSSRIHFQNNMFEPMLPNQPET